MAYFDAHTERVNKINAPLLVIGFGGTGADGVLRVKHEFSQRFNLDKVGNATLDRPPRTAYLVFDTDPDDACRKRYRGTSLDRNTEVVDLHCDISHLLDNKGANLRPEVKLWLDEEFYKSPSPELMEEVATNGAGTFRQISRLMLFEKAGTVLSRLEGTLNNLAKLPAGSPPGAKKINVAVVTGLAGGTGSGTFLDIAYMVRYAASVINQKVVVDLYAVAPDVTIQHHADNDEGKQEIYKVNSFAAFKELDYWMNIDSRQTGNLADEAFAVHYPNGRTVRWAERPFNSVTLLCATNAEGVLLENCYGVVMNSFAETLVFMFADEQVRQASDTVGTDYADANDSFSFQSARSNEYAYRRNIRHPYPEGYSYRAIGAYSNLSEQRNRISIEGNLLFQDLRAFCLADEQQPNMSGALPGEFFENAYETPAQLIESEFMRNTAYPEQYFSKIAPYSDNDIRNDPEKAPHAKEFSVWEQTAQDIASDLGSDYGDRLFTSFINQCCQYLKARGPHSLRTLLTAPEVGIIARYEAQLIEVENNIIKFESDHSVQYDHAGTAYKEWMELRFPRTVADSLSDAMKLPSYFDTYIKSAEAQYVTKQWCLFNRQLYKGLEAMIRQIKTVTLFVLDFAIAAMDDIAEELAEDVRNIPTGGGALHVIDLDEIKRTIRETYQANDNSTRLRNCAMECIENCLMGARNVTNDTEAAEVLISGLQSMLDEIYHTINDMSLTAQLQHAGVVNNHNSVQQYAQTNLAPTLERGAEVHFTLTPGYGELTTSNAVLTSYVSVPDNQPDIRKGIADFLQGHRNGTIKNSAIHDRVFWLNICSGLPLCAYAFLNDYEALYERRRKNRPGVHLLMSGLSDRQNIHYDWAFLPSPNPYMLHTSSANAPETLVSRRKSDEAAIAAAQEAGLLALDCSSVDVNGFTAELRMLADDEGRILTGDALKEAMASVPPTTTGNAEGEETLLLARKAAIEAIINRRTSDMRLSLDYIDDRMMRFSGDQNVADDIALPFGDPKAKAARERCFRAYAYYAVAKRPVLLQALEAQTAPLKSLQAELAAVEKRLSGLHEFDRKVQELAKTVALLMLYDEIVPDIGRYGYRGMDGQWQTSGRENVLFRLQDSLHADATWTPRLMAFALVEWLAAQDLKEDPIAMILGRLEDKEARASQMHRENADDVAAMREYCERGRKLIDGMNEQANELHSREAMQEIGDEKLRARILDVIAIMTRTIQSKINMWKPFI